MKAHWIKLEILRQYLRKWLPVFIKDHNRTWLKLAIYDLFAGAGADKDGTPGSPIIILDEIKLYCNEIVKRNMSVLVVLNEAKKRKAKRLSECCNTTLDNCKHDSGSDYACPSKDNSDCCFKLLHAMKIFRASLRFCSRNSKNLLKHRNLCFLTNTVSSM